MKLLSSYNIKDWPRAILAYLGDAGHRRFAAMIAAMVSTKLLGHEIGQDDVANIIEIVLGGVGGLWNKHSVQAPEVVQ